MEDPVRHANHLVSVWSDIYMNKQITSLFRRKKNHSLNFFLHRRFEFLTRCCGLCKAKVQQHDNLWCLLHHEFYVNEINAIFWWAGPILESSERVKTVLFSPVTNCRRAAATICLRPLQVDTIFVFIRRVASVPACWLFNTSATSWPFDLESGIRVTCDVGYLCANFSLPRPLCSPLRPDVRDRRQTDVRQKHRLMPQPYGGGGII